VAGRTNVANQWIERSGYETVSIRLCRIFCCFRVGASSSARFQMERLRIPRSGYEYECRERKSNSSCWRRRRSVPLPRTQLRCRNWTCLFMDNAHTGVEVGTRPLSATSIAMAASKWMWVAANDLARSTHASLHSRLGRILAIVRSAVFIPLPTACSD